ncbi:MAG: hypothetical protein AAF098_10325 [Pseudomonadota bacterium]
MRYDPANKLARADQADSVTGATEAIKTGEPHPFGADPLDAFKYDAKMWVATDDIIAGFWR